jgi:hypothetical protein
MKPKYEKPIQRDMSDFVIVRGSCKKGTNPGVPGCANGKTAAGCGPGQTDGSIACSPGSSAM